MKSMKRPEFCVMSKHKQPLLGLQVCLDFNLICITVGNICKSDHVITNHNITMMSGMGYCDKHRWLQQRCDSSVKTNADMPIWACVKMATLTLWLRSFSGYPSGGTEIIFYKPSSGTNFPFQCQLFGMDFFPGVRNVALSHLQYSLSVYYDNNNASIFILRRLHQDDNERVITTLWTEAHYI